MDFLMTLCAESIYIIENFLIVFGYLVFMEYKGKHLKRDIVFQVFFIYFFQKISTPLSLYLTGTNVFSVLANIIMMTILTFVFYRGGLWRRFFGIIMYLGPALLAELLVWPSIHNIIERIEGADAAYQIIYSIREYRNLAIILCGQIILVLWVIVLLVWKICEEKRWMKEYILFLVIPIYQLIIFLVYYNGCEKIDVPSIVVGWLLYLFGILIDVAILYLITGMIKKMKLEKELSALYKKRTEELDYYMQVNNHMEEVRELRHEFANQLQVIYGLLEEEDTDKVIRMLDATNKYVESKFEVVKGE